MHAATILEITIPALGLLGGVTGVIYTAGRIVGRWMSKLDNNTSAIEKLTGLYEKHVGIVGDKLDDHEHRITVLETRAKAR